MDGVGHKFPGYSAHLDIFGLWSLKPFLTFRQCAFVNEWNHANAEIFRKKNRFEISVSVRKNGYLLAFYVCSRRSCHRNHFFRIFIIFVFFDFPVWYFFWFFMCIFF